MFLTEKTTFFVLAGYLLLALSLSTAVRGDDDEKELPFAIHGFLSQGFMWTTDNNYLSLRSSEGSFDWREAAINASVELTSKLHFGLQLYARELGELGNYALELDWAYLDYRWRDFLGLRIGKIKTPFGLYNDEQDLEFLQTWILLPQSIYPIGQRTQNLSHKGLDLYGEIPPSRLGSLSYQTFAGRRSLDTHGGFYKRYEERGMPISEYDVKWLAGFNLEWKPPLEGLRVVASFLADEYEISGKRTSNGKAFRRRTDRARTVFRLGAEYAWRDLVVAAEYEQTRQQFVDSIDQDMQGGKGQGGRGQQGAEMHGGNRRGYYASLAYRLNRRLETGAYYSELLPGSEKENGDSSDFTRDWCLTLRLDITQNWSLKGETHFIEGTALGLLSGSNPGGFEPRWTMFAAKLTFNF